MTSKGWWKGGRTTVVCSKTEHAVTKNEIKKKRLRCSYIPCQHSIFLVLLLVMPKETVSLPYAQTKEAHLQLMPSRIQAAQPDI